jgi:dsDNA-specific endonuclease/ATPase MutS2
MSKLKLDLHPIYNDSGLIEREVHRVVNEACDKKIRLVEIIPGKGSGQLKKAILRILTRPPLNKVGYRIEKDDKNFGRIFLHLKFER